MGHEIRRLRIGDEAIAARLFALLAHELGDAHRPLSTRARRERLSRPDLWVIAAFEARTVVGGLTAHMLPMTRSASTELLIYDLAVAASHRRRGLGRALLAHVLATARADGRGDAFVLAETADRDACAFYRALGARAAAATMFTFGRGVRA